VPEWLSALAFIVGGLLFLMALRMPVAFCFLLVNLVVGSFFWGSLGPEQVIDSIRHSVSTFTLLPIPLFVLMGTVMFRSGLAPLMIDAIAKWLGRLPGRLGLLAVGAGTVFATLSGSSMASAAMLGSALIPEMTKQGYKKPMTLGPILGSGGLAIMIPPSGLAVLLGAIAEISIGQILIAIIIPGLLMAFLYAIYIVARCFLQPELAPAYDVTDLSLMEKVVPTVRYVLPLGFIIFLVVGLIFLGVATPSEAAATGAIGTYLLAAAYRRLNWQLLKTSVTDCVQISGMTLMILAGARGYSQILAFSGATSSLAEFAMELPVAPIILFLLMQVTVMIMGMFISSGSIFMITLPLFMPIIRSLGINEIWFAVVTLINIEMSATTPPFGMVLFVMKGVAPPGTTMGEIYKAGLPFLGCDLIAMSLIIGFPGLALFLPGLMS
jgi:tripartite ATP-independent transporter DctM subunit